MPSSSNVPALPPLMANGAGTVGGIGGARQLAHSTHKFMFDDASKGRSAAIPVAPSAAPAPKAARQSGGAATSTKSIARPPKPHNAPSSRTVPTQRSRLREKTQASERKGKLLSQNELDADAAVGAHDFDRGVLSAMERGLLPPGFDMGSALAGPPDATALGPLSASAAPMHKHVDQFRRHEVLTADLGFGGMMNVRVDLDAIERSPTPPSSPPPPPAQQKPQPPPPPPAKDAEAEAAPKEREDARTYAELLDIYSLHEFIIRRGLALRTTPEFVSYQRSYTAQWGAINEVIGHLEKLLSEFGVPLAYIDGKKLAKLAAVDLGTPSREQLLSCLANRGDVEPLLISQAQVFKQGPRGHDVAATKIQALARMRLQRRRFTHLRAATFAAMLIQRQWAVHRGHMKTRKTLAVQRDALIAKWRQTMVQFAADWPRIADSRRVIVHIPSMSVSAFQAQTTPFFEQLQRSQLGRLCDLADDKVEIVLLSPLPYENEALQYYYSMLQAAGVRAPESRVVILVPENHKRLPGHMSLAKHVLCSSRLMRALSAVVRGKAAYIVPGVVGPEEQMLAARLNLPILGPEPRVSLALGTKSGAKSIVEAADAVAPVGAHNIRSAADLYGALARLVAEYPEFPRWLIKIDTEHASRGHAFLDVRKLAAVEEVQKSPESYEHQDTERLAADVARELEDGGGKRIKVLNTHVYPDWAAYTRAIESSGCCVEAVPADIVGSVVANVFIEPDGTARLQSIQQQIASPQYTCAGVLHPQTSAPFEAVRDAAMSIAGAAFRKKITGYVSIDFVIFRRADTRALRMWAVDLELRITNNALTHSLAMLTTGAQYDHDTGHCVLRAHHQQQNNSDQTSSLNGSVAAASSVPDDGSAVSKPLCYAYSGVLHHPFISALRHAAFFSMCKQRGLSFDIQTRTGVVYHLVDVLLCNCLGFLCIAGDQHQCAAMLLDAVDFLQQQLNAANATHTDGTCNVSPMLTAARNMAQKAAVERRRVIGQQQQVMQGSASRSLGGAGRGSRR